MQIRAGFASFFLAVLSVLVFAVGCGNKPAAGQCTSDADCGGQFCVNGGCMQCRADNNCNASDKCMECSGNQCVRAADCCTTDAECGSGRRCINVPGKAYGRCGAR